MRLRRGRHGLPLIAGGLLLPVALLGAEVLLAQRGPRLTDAPLALDRPTSDPNARQVVWLGDSTAAGVGADAPGALPSVVADRTPAAAERLVVLARSGATVADVVEEQLPELSTMRPDMIYVSVGANDVTALTRTRTFRRSYRSLLDALPKQADVVLLGVPDMGAPPRLAQPLRAIAGWRGRTLDAVVRDLAAERGSTYIDIAGATGSKMRSDTSRYFAADRYHPSPDGYALWADAVIAATAV